MNEQQKREAEEHAAKLRELLTAYMEGHDPCADEILEIAQLNPVEADELYALWNQTKEHDGCISEDDAVRLSLYLWQGNVRVVKQVNLGMNAFFNAIDDDLPPKKDEGIDLDSLLDTPLPHQPALKKTRRPRAKEQFPRAICRSTCCDAEGFRFSPARDGCASCKPNWGQY